MLLDQTLKFLNQYNISIDPSLDEQQLVDIEAINSLIKHARLDKNDTVIEIGPGIGNITIELAEVAGNVYALEKNQKFIEPLTERCSAFTNITVVHGDALRETYPEFTKLVSNLPYRICEAVFQRLTQEIFDTACLITSSSFAEKITARKMDKHYSKLSLISQIFFEVRLVENIPPDSYYPQPQVETSVITLHPCTNISKPIQIMQDLLRQNDKKTRNALREAFIRTGLSSTKKKSKQIISNFNLPESILEKRVARLPLTSLEIIYQNISID
jgi:16S rRNA (adenine1518-N6/adenine1519-N6)-dimethyltransferase